MVCAADWTADISAFYGSPDVRSRISEYCGGGNTESPESFTCWRIAAFGGRDRLSEAEEFCRAHDKAAWPRLLVDGADVSMVDRAGTLLQMAWTTSTSRTRRALPAPGADLCPPRARLPHAADAARGVRRRHPRPRHRAWLPPDHAGALRKPLSRRARGDRAAPHSLINRYGDRARSVRSAGLMGWGHEGAGRLPGASLPPRAPSPPRPDRGAGHAGRPAAPGRRALHLPRPHRVCRSRLRAPCALRVFGQSALGDDPPRPRSGPS